MLCIVQRIGVNTRECDITPGSNVGDIHAGEVRAIRERIVADVSNGVRYGDAGQARAFRERPVTDGGDGVGDGYAGQARASIERIIFNGGNVVGYDKICHLHIIKI